MENKTCKRCNLPKPLTKFTRKEGSRRSNICGQCVKDAAKSTGRCLECASPSVYGKTLCETCAIRGMERNRKRRKLNRLAVMEHYSGSPPKCMCPGCNENHIEFLTIEHIGGWGKNHRMECGNATDAIIREGFPSGITIMCFNCNCSRGFHGYCPHEK